MKKTPKQLNLKKQPDLVSGIVDALAEDIKGWIGQSGETVSAIEALLYAQPDYKQGKPIIDPENITDPECHNLFSKQWLSKALTLTKIHPEVFDFMVEMGAGNLITNGPMPHMLKLFLGEVMYGARKRPRGKGRTVAENQFRDFAILEAVKQAMYECDVTFDKTSTSASICAKDLVAMAFERAGHKSVTADAIKNVWQKRNHAGGREQQYQDFKEASRLLGKHS